MAQSLKYQFESKEAWETMKATIETTESTPEGDVSSIEGATVIEVGHIMLTPPVYAEGDPDTIVTEATLETAYSVDILWDEAEAKGFEAYRIYPNPDTMKHTFYGMDDLYKEEYNNRPL